MTKEQQIEELAKLVQAKEVYPCGDDEHCEDCYCVEFDELIPSIMSDKIDELLQEYEK